MLEPTVVCFLEIHWTLCGLLSWPQGHASIPSRGPQAPGLPCVRVCGRGIVVEERALPFLGARDSLVGKLADVVPGLHHVLFD